MSILNKSVPSSKKSLKAQDRHSARVWGLEELELWGNFSLSEQSSQSEQTRVALLWRPNWLSLGAGQRRLSKQVLDSGQKTGRGSRSAPGSHFYLGLFGLRLVAKPASILNALSFCNRLMMMLFLSLPRSYPIRR